MAEFIQKVVLIEKIQQGYEQFEAFLAQLSEEQLTTPGVNSTWSIKDNLSHLTHWQSSIDDKLAGLLAGQEPPQRLPNLETEDAINEYVYQENKDRSLADVRERFRASYDHLLATVQALSEEQLNSPFPWAKHRFNAWEYIAGNTYEHYQEHSEFIRNWLSHQ
jgi:hypothetical protein